jgi:hypothetical protein
VALATGVLLSLPAAPAHGWGRTGHEHITEGAIGHLPLPLRGFFAAHESDVVEMAGDEPPGSHWIDIDYYPEFFAGTFPRDVNMLIAKYGSSTVNSIGMGPWTYANYVTSLSQAMAAAQTPTAWNNLLGTAAAMAHYIEDLHNPLHLTLNYDGQLTGNDGIHSRYESSMISRFQNQLVFTPAAAQHLPSPIDFVFDGIDQHYGFVDDIMTADDLAPHNSGNTAYYNSMWAQTGAFTKVLFQEASVAVASSWYTAWVNAGSPRTFLSYAADFQADGDVDGGDLDVWRQSFGTNSVADADGNGVSDGADFLMWQRQRTPAVASASNVPEPAAGELIGAALAVTAIALGRGRSHARA